jgi:hypothetical protein
MGVTLRARAREGHAIARAIIASAARGNLHPMNVAELLRQHLADARRRGEPFESAWPVASKRAVAGQRADERTLWRAALADTRPAWEAAFERRPATRAQVAVLAIAPDPDRERVAA